MKSVAEIGRIGHGLAAKTESKSFSLDTTFVLFFLALEFGRTATALSLDLVLMAVALLGVVVLPLFLPGDERPEFGGMLAGRAWIGAFGAVLGVAFNQLVGGVLPEMLRFAPMSLLIVSALLSCQIQFYRFLRFRPER